MNKDLELLRKASDLLQKDQFAQALSRTEDVARNAANWDLSQRLAQIRMSYELMLSYFSQGIDDEARSQVLVELKMSLHDIIDSITLRYGLAEQSRLYFVVKNSFDGKSFADYFAQFSGLNNKLVLLNSVDVAERNMSAIKSLENDITDAENNIFRYLWTAGKLSPNEVELILSVANDSSFPSHVLCLITSALLMALLEFYDEQKLITLFRIYSSSAPLQVRLRAIVGIVLAMFVNDKRVAMSRNIRELVAELADDSVFCRDVETVFIRLVNARNTQNLAEFLNNDILPGFKSLETDLKNNLRGADPADIADLAENPIWQEKLEDSGLAKKMEEINEIQQQGGDVLISAFSRLKIFPFFNTMSNWFLPFHLSASWVISESDRQIFNTLASVPYLCDSDKFSAYFSMKNSANDKYAGVMRQVAEEADEIAEDNRNSLDKEEKTIDSIINKYIQDLYRFFTLYSRRKEFYPLFDTKFNLLTVPFLAQILNTEHTLSIIAEFYFHNKFYDDAIYFFNRLLEHKPQNTPLILQKIGFAYQNKGNMEKALSYYLRFELAIDNDFWNTRHIASCYSSMKDHKHALEYYRKADSISPDNISVNLNIGHCLLAMGNAQEALKYYFKTSFLNDHKHRSWRPIAWCSFLTGNYEQSCNYYSQIVTQTSPTAQDFLNYGHVLLASAQRKQAIEQYRSAITSLNGDVTRFVEMFRTDMSLLRDKGVTLDDIHLSIDSAIMLYNNSLKQ